MDLEVPLEYLGSVMVIFASEEAANVDFTKSPAEISNVKRHDVSESSTIPNVVGSNEASAISILKSHGFTSVEVNYISVVDSSKNGKVISQTPKNSSKAYPLSTTVTINVGKFVG